MSVWRQFSVCTLVVFTLLLTRPVQSYTDPVLDPVTITDDHNNQADADSNITWAEVPEGKPYETGMA